MTTIPVQLILNNLFSLTELFLDNNLLTSIPKEITFLHNLKILSLNDNDLTELPNELGKIETLHYLGIKGNKQLMQIPFSVVDCHQMLEIKHDIEKEYNIPWQFIRQIGSAPCNNREPFIAALTNYGNYIQKFGVKLSTRSHWIAEKERDACVGCNDLFGNLTRKVCCFLSSYFLNIYFSINDYSIIAFL